MEDPLPFQVTDFTTSFSSLSFYPIVVLFLIDSFGAFLPSVVLVYLSMVLEISFLNPIYSHPLFTFS